MEPPRRSHLVELGYWSLAWSVPISIAIGYGLGWWLDERLGTSPWLQVVGFFLGAAAALVQLLQMAGKDRDQH
ncbi:MAG TPA: AtpZ/AtpI family protein [Armatimonadota bacterium]|nr:AtpZ/AtpI family protein [Armatimonadota bacterium]